MWLYAAECEGGGISAWNDAGKWHSAYPEVTGYLLPTMVKWGADDLALRCANWLLSVQNADGSFNGIDGTPRPFDTAAIVEGLVFVYNEINQEKFIQAAAKAREWMRTQINADGCLVNSPNLPTAEIYNLRASAILHNPRELEYWQENGLNNKEQRSHYLAYALEGALNFDNDDEWAKSHIEMCCAMNPGLMPFYVRPDWSTNHAHYDYCASAQMGILYERIGLDVSRLYRLLEAIVEPNGGIPQSDGDRRQIAWAVKFWLDFKEMMQ